MPILNLVLVFEITNPQNALLLLLLAAVAAVAVGVFACAIRSGVVNAPTAPPVVTSLTMIVPFVLACWSSNKLPTTAVLDDNTVHMNVASDLGDLWRIEAYRGQQSRDQPRHFHSKRR